MVSSFSLAVLLASVASLVRADVNPSTPDTGKAGSTCSIVWAADTNSTTNWADMSIELMTGSNYNMVFMTTVATGLDGTKDGTFSWTCPQVNPYSDIYFYQFVSPLETSNPLWTTRFAIASSSGATTTPTNSTQPDGESIPWGTGALVDAVASAPPSFASDVPDGVVTASTVTAATISSSSSSASAISSGSAAAAAGNTKGAAGATGTTPVVLATASPSSSSSSSNGGLGLAVDGRVWMTAFGVMSSLTGLAMLL